MKKIYILLALFALNNVTHTMPEYDIIVTKNKNIASIHFVSKSNQKIGFVDYSYNNNDYSGYINRLYVNPSFRSNGLGTLLMRYTFKELQQVGCTKISWVALPDDPSKLPALIKFYKSLEAVKVFKSLHFVHFEYRPQIPSKI